MPQFSIHHVTRYTYAEPVRDSANQVMLFPIKDSFQSVQNQRLVISGDPVLEMYTDYYGNEYATFSSIHPHTELVIDSTITVITLPVTLPADDKPVDLQWNHLQEIRYVIPYIDFLKQEYFNALPEVKMVADIGYYHTVSVFTAVKQLTEYVYQNFKYIQGVTSVSTTVDEVWQLRAGVCQDFAHILLVMLRLLGIPARYVSGYVCPRESHLRGEGATHAWVEAYIPFYGWLGFDPTNNCVVNDLHVRLAIGRNFADCSPVKGTYKGTAKQTLEVGVSVSYEDGRRAGYTPAVLKPQASATPQAEANGDNNSYQQHLKKMQQQQQQQ